jgi:hypothetical protein
MCWQLCSTSLLRINQEAFLLQLNIYCMKVTVVLREDACHPQRFLSPKTRPRGDMGVLAATRLQLPTHFLTCDDYWSRLGHHFVPQYAMNFWGADPGSRTLEKKTIGLCLIGQRGQSFAEPRGPNGKLKVHYNNRNISRDVVPLKMMCKV